MQAGGPGSLRRPRIQLPLRWGRRRPERGRRRRRRCARRLRRGQWQLVERSVVGRKLGSRLLRLVVRVRFGLELGFGVGIWIGVGFGVRFGIEFGIGVRVGVGIGRHVRGSQHARRMHRVHDRRTRVPAQRLLWRLLLRHEHRQVQGAGHLLTAGPRDHAARRAAIASTKARDCAAWGSPPVRWSDAWGSRESSASIVAISVR